MDQPFESALDDDRLVRREAPIEAIYQAGRMRDEVQVNALLDAHREQHGDTEQVVYADRAEHRQDDEDLGRFPFHENAHMVPGSPLMDMDLVIRQYSERLLQATDIAVVRRLLDLGANPDARDSEGNTPLINTLRESRVDGQNAWQINERTRLLLDAGADPSLANEHGTTPLHEARTVDQADMLIEAGADVHAANHQQRTALHNQWNSGIAASLIRAGADIDAQDDHGNTPLSIAASLGQEDTLNLLLESGADETIANKYNDAPGYRAMTGGREDLAERIENAAQFRSDRQREFLQASTWSPGDMSGDEYLPQGQGEQQVQRSVQTRRL